MNRIYSCLRRLNPFANIQLRLPGTSLATAMPFCVAGQSLRKRAHVESGQGGQNTQVGQNEQGGQGLKLDQPVE